MQALQARPIDENRMIETDMQTLIGTRILENRIRGTRPIEAMLAEARTAPQTMTLEEAEKVLCRIADYRAAAACIRADGETMARQSEREANRLEYLHGPALQDVANRACVCMRRKTITLARGAIGFRTRPASVSVTDDAKALAWARQNAPEAVCERLDLKALAAVLKARGETLPFASYAAPEEEFFVRAW